MELTKEQKQKIDKIGGKYDLKLILLHGSCARGRQRRGSDLDIAILGRKPIELKALLKIYSEMGDIFGDNRQRELDIKSLHKVSPLFCYHVAKYSQLFYGKISDYSEFRAYAFKVFYDAKDLFDLEKTLISKFQNYLSEKYPY